VNWVLRRIFGLKRDEVIGGRRNCIMRSFIARILPQICLMRMMKSRRMGWAEPAARNGNEDDCIEAFVGMPEGSIPLGRPIRRWENNIEVDLKERVRVVRTGLISGEHL
jgi:hypothetical protein